MEVSCNAAANAASAAPSPAAPGATGVAHASTSSAPDAVLPAASDANASAAAAEGGSQSYLADPEFTVSIIVVLPSIESALFFLVASLYM